MTNCIKTDVIKFCTIIYDKLFLMMKENKYDIELTLNPHQMSKLLTTKNFNYMEGVKISIKGRQHFDWDTWQDVPTANKRQEAELKVEMWGCKQCVTCWKLCFSNIYEKLMELKIIGHNFVSWSLTFKKLEYATSNCLGTFLACCLFSKRYTDIYIIYYNFLIYFKQTSKTFWTSEN